MSVDLNKYDNVKFHEKEGVDNKIRAYMVIFDYTSEINKLTDTQKVELFIEWERIFLEEEFYEIIPCLTFRRKKLEEKIKTDNMSFIGGLAYKLSNIISDLIRNKEK